MWLLGAFNTAAALLRFSPNTTIAGIAAVMVPATNATAATAAAAAGGPGASAKGAGGGLSGGSGGAAGPGFQVHRRPVVYMGVAMTSINLVHTYAAGYLAL